MKYVKTWENKGQRPCWAHIHIQMSGKKFEELTGFRYQKPLYIADDQGHNTAYFLEEEMQQATKHFENFWNEKTIENYFFVVKEFFEKAEEYKKRCFGKDVATHTEEEIISYLKEYEEICCFRYIFITNPPHILPLENKLHELLQEYDEKEEIIVIITQNEQALPFDKEEQEIANLSEIWNMLSKEKQEEELRRLETEYGWFAGIEGEQRNDWKHYKKRILTHKQKTVGKKSIPSLDPEVLDLGSILGRLANARIWCRWYGMTLRYCARLYIEELERRWNLTDLRYLTLPEIYQLHELLFTKKKRKQGYSTTLEKETVKIQTGKEHRKHLEKIQQYKTTNITGRCAYPGKVIGKVRVIDFIADDYHKQVELFQEGEILVTGMTRPQIAHLCKKASGIITDEGGIICHAAIISREYEVPCIVGAQNATKVLQTGDIIEIDAKNSKIMKL